MGGASGPAGVPYRNIHYINKNKCIGGVSVRVSSLLGIFLRMFDLVFFHDLFALDHTASTVGTTVLPFFSGCATAWTAGEILNLGTGYFLLGFLLGTEADSTRDPLNKPDKVVNWCENDKYGHDRSNDPIDPVKRIRLSRSK